jgi:hypothetical protein
MRRQLLLSLTLFCLTLTVACKDHPTWTGPLDGGALHTPPDLQAKLDAEGTASVLLPTKPLTVACYIKYVGNDADERWDPAYTAFDGHLDTPWCALTHSATEWRLFMFSSSNYAGATAGFVVAY